jgi:hypothetical protein
MRFRITNHSGSGAPADALDLLWARIQGRRFEDLVFSRGGNEIGVSVGHDSPISMERDEREEVARLEVLDFLREICERVPEIRFNWYAVGPRR